MAVPPIMATALWLTPLPAWLLRGCGPATRPPTMQAMGQAQTRRLVMATRARSRNPTTIARLASPHSRRPALRDNSPRWRGRACPPQRPHLSLRPCPRVFPLRQRQRESLLPRLLPRLLLRLHPRLLPCLHPYLHPLPRLRPRLLMPPKQTSTLLSSRAALAATAARPAARVPARRSRLCRTSRACLRARTWRRGRRRALHARRAVPAVSLVAAAAAQSRSTMRSPRPQQRARAA